MRHCAFEEIRVGLKIGIENGNKFIVFNIATIHSGLEITSLVTISDYPMPVHNVGTLLLPFMDLLFDQQLRCWVIRIIKNLNQNLRFRPVQITYSSD